MARPPTLPPPHRRLSARLLVLTIVFVLIGEVLIYVPSIARFRHVYLEERIAAAQLATLSLEAAPGQRVPVEVEDRLMGHAGILSVTLRRDDFELMLGELPAIDAVFDLREAGFFDLIRESFVTLRHQGQRTIRVIGPSPQEVGTLVDISLPEGPMWGEMVEYSWRILYLSIVLSLIVALAVFVCLQLLIVRPLARITDSLIGFRDHPEDSLRDIAIRDRGDEIGVVERELARMQEGLRAALAQKTRLAALGTAVGKINHDLRNLIATAILLSDRLERSQDPEVRKIAPRLIEAMERAARLCSETLAFAREPTRQLRATRFALAPLAEEVGAALRDGAPAAILWENRVPADLAVTADRDQLHRVLLNLVHNSRDVLATSGGRITLRAHGTEDGVCIEVVDTGPGLPARAQAHLFEPFASSTRPGGSGLGLAIAREIMRAHGGDITLLRTGPDGTVFRLDLPDRAPERRAA